MAEKGKYSYDYPRPAVAADIIVLTEHKEKRQILLIKRKFNPFAGMYALPGGFVDPDETTDQAAARELKEETGISNDDLKQFRVYSNPDRDPRGRVISVIYFVYLPENTFAKAGDDADSVHWVDTDKIPPLAFDHETILADFFASQTD